MESKETRISILLREIEIQDPYGAIAEKLANANIVTMRDLADTNYETLSKAGLSRAECMNILYNSFVSMYKRVSDILDGYYD